MGGAMRILVIAIIAACSMGCAGSWLGKNIGVYSGMDLEFDYGHNFGDPSGGSLTGNLDPEHGRFGPSSFTIDRADQYPEDTVRTGFRILLRPE